MSTRIEGIGELLGNAREILDLTLDNMENYGVSRRTWARIENDNEAVNSAKLCGILAKLRDRAEKLDADERRGKQHPTPDDATFVYRVGEVVRQIIAIASDQLVDSRIVLGDPLRLLDRTEIVELSRAWKAPVGNLQAAEFKSREGDASAAEQFFEQVRAVQALALFRTYMAQGDNWFRNFEFDQALAPYAEAVHLMPHDTRAQLGVARASLCARTGDPIAHWRRAFEILSRPVPESAAHFGEWQAWLGIAWYRHPTANPAEKLPHAENSFRAALTYSGPVNPLDRAVWESNLGVTLFATGQRQKQCEAKGLFDAALLAWPKSERPYEWGMAMKRIANYWLLIPEKNSQRRLENLQRAWDYYDKACDPYDSPRFSVERAQVEYSWADVAIALAQVDADNAESHFKAAEKLCKKAIERLTPANGEDWGRAQYNLARSLHTRPAPQDKDLKNAIAAYQETLRIYTRDFIPTEWSETHFPLSFAYEQLASRRSDCKLFRLAIASVKAALTIDKRYGNYPAYEKRLKQLKIKYEALPGSQKIPFDEIPCAE